MRRSIRNTIAIAIGVVIAAAALVIAFLRPSATSAADQVSVRLPIPIIESGQASFYLAEDRNYFTEENISVRFERGSKDLNPVKMVASGQDMIGLLGGPDTLLVARSKGQPLKAIAVLHRNSNFPCLVTLKSSGLTTLQQLAGKKIGFFYGHISTDVLRNLFRKNDIAYTEVDVGFDYSQLIAKQIDAEWAFTVTAGIDLPAKGVEINVISPADYGIVTHGYTIFATEQIIRDKNDLVFRFLRATLKGVRDAVAAPDEATRSLLKRDSQLPYDLNLKRQQAYNAVTSNSEQYPAGYMDEEMFRTTYERLVEEKVIEQPFDPRDAYTTEFLERIYVHPAGS